MCNWDCCGFVGWVLLSVFCFITLGVSCNLQRTENWLHLIVLNWELSIMLLGGGIKVPLIVSCTIILFYL